MNSGFQLSQADGRPMYRQIMEQVRRRVAVGDWPAGAQIPSIRALAVSLKVSVITVKRAYLELEREGVIATRQGKGSFVADTVDLDRKLRERELDGHLDRALGLASILGLSIEELVLRLRERKDGEDS